MHESPTSQPAENARVGVPASPSRAQWIEIGIACAITLALAWLLPLRMLWGIAAAGARALVSAWELAPIDGATIGDAVLAIVRSILLVAPAVVAFARASRVRLVWVPLALLPLLIALATAPHGLGSWARVALFAIPSAIGIVAQRWPSMRWTAALPVLIAIHPTLTVHQHVRAELDFVQERCRTNDGERPRGFRPSLVRPNYYAVTAIGDRLLLTGEGVSSWLVRDANGRLRFAARSDLRGNYWRGSTDDGVGFFVHRDEMRTVRWELVEELTTIPLRNVRAPWEVDLINTVYDPATQTTFAGEFAAGGLLRVPRDGRPTRIPLDMFYLQLANGPDGTIVGTSSTDLAIIDAASGRVRQRMPAALCTGSVASCPIDHAVAVTDFAGRVRLFERDARGRYAFTRSGAVMAPRRVVFSPDCSALAVASADDTTVSVLRRFDLRVMKTYRVGPALRDLLWLPDGDLLVVDACTVTRLERY